MKRQDIFHMCLQNLMRRKSRTFLTVLGVVIGCCSIVIMISLGIGMKESQEKMLSQMGDLTIITVTAPQGGHGKVKLDDTLVKKIKNMNGVEAVTPKISLDGYNLRLITGTGKRYTADWTSVVGLDLGEMVKTGYSFTEGSLPKNKGDVAVGQYIAYDFKDTLRPDGSNTIDRYAGGVDENGNAADIPAPYFNALKEDLTLEIDNGTSKFTVKLHPTGLLKEDYAKGQETSDGIVMSLTDLRDLLDKAQGSQKKTVPYSSIIVKAADLSKVEELEGSIKELGCSTESMESIRKPMEKEARQKQLMLGGLGAISLFVAALGITNTMIMSISERIREIGIMKALGCYVRDIRTIFLAEAGCIGLIGGIAGCVLSFLISIVINLVSLGSLSLANLAAAAVGGSDITRVSVIPLWLMVFAVLFSVCIGLGSGYYPARRAMRVSALEAIKSSE
ncbi:MAG TPA: ABC transporter permease [Lachnospiraceae bacterium]|nr:ABC transporter permease [Lachnospiraceae bacterium]